MNTSSIIKLFDEKLVEIIQEDLPIIKDIKNYVIESGGKRIRPLIHYIFAKLLGAKGNSCITVGTVAELIHAASLLHDDVVDGAETRRGRLTVGKKFGNKTAILTGDYLLACGIYSLNQLNNPSLMNSFTRVIRDLSVGELLQMEWEKNPEITLDIYRKIIYGKTSSLFGTVCESAGILASKKGNECQALRDFGITLGDLFQVRDDYIDYFSPEDESGKKPMKDFYNGLYTFPMIFLKSCVTINVRKKIHSLMEKKSRSAADAKYVMGLMDHLKIKQLIAEYINEDIIRLEKYVSEFPKNIYRSAVSDRLDSLKL